MGAGKTTFIHALCDVKGVTSTVGSPTFSIINEYVWPGGSMFHIDLYRLKDEEGSRSGGCGRLPVFGQDLPGGMA